jgi:hypothetical protein
MHGERIKKKQKYQLKAIKVKNQKQKIYEIKPKLHYKYLNVKHLTKTKGIKVFPPNLVVL